jgi:hypothetical protein
VAAIPISNDLNANALLIYLEQIVNGLLAHNVKVTSYSADGAETERSVQRLMKAKGIKQIIYTIKSPHPGCPDHEISIPVFKGGQVMVMQQDPEHFLKTMRNNLFSGARLLTFGNRTALYRRIRQIAFEDGSPLYHRDVEKLDRQDDNAATRLASAAMQEFMTQNHPDFVFEIDFLFFVGELSDALQSRHMAHSERIKLALRARYFLDMWETFLDGCGYNCAKYYLSREAADIARTLIDGLISLIIVYRDHIPGKYPLLPWMHSTVPCEHSFGQYRIIIPDFTMLNVIFMQPKLSIKLREAVLRGRSSDPKARASGYCHTYFDTHGIDLATLATYPSDEEIQRMALEAAQEADSLVKLLGVNPEQLWHRKSANIPMLPSIDMWYDYDDDSSEHETDDGSDDANELQNLVDIEGNPVGSRTVKQDKQLLALTYASLSITADKLTKM